MIEHITSDGGSHPDHYDLMAKINELVDAVNLMTHNPQPNPQPCCVVLEQNNLLFEHLKGRVAFAIEALNRIGKDSPEWKEYVDKVIFDIKCI